MRSGAVTMTSQGILYILQIVSVAILARLLTPEDYGLIAMVTAVTVFARLFKDLGLSAATIQKPGITIDQLSSMFWINVSMGLMMTLAVAALAPVAAWFYEEPELLGITRALALTFFIASLATQQGALLTRQMRFTALSAVQITGVLVSMTVSIAIALRGGGVWALVSGTLAASATGAVGMWVISDWRPGWFVKGSGVRELLGFGANVTGFGVANYFHRNLDNVLIGRVWGPGQLGLYTRAYALLMLPIANLRGPLNRVALPAMSRLQDQPQRYRSFFLHYVSILAFLSMPLVGFLYVCSEDVIQLILGSRWIGASEIFAILAFGGLIQPVASLRGLVLMSSGQGGRYLRWGVANAIATVIGFACGLPWGAKGVAAGYVVVNYLILHPSLIYVFRNTPLRPRDFYFSIARPLTATVVMSVALLLFRARLPISTTVGVLAASSVCAVPIFLAIFSLLPGGREALREHCANAMQLFRGSGVAATEAGAPLSGDLPKNSAIGGGKRP